MKSRTSHEEYDHGQDPLSISMKHIMLRNGILESHINNFKQATCCCGHSKFDHIDCVGCCIVKSKEICICDGFKEKGIISTYIPKKKIPYQQKKQTADVIVKEGKIIHPSNNTGLSRSSLI